MMRASTKHVLTSMLCLSCDNLVRSGVVLHDRYDVVLM